MALEQPHYEPPKKETLSSQIEEGKTMGKKLSQKETQKQKQHEAISKNQDQSLLKGLLTKLHTLPLKKLPQSNNNLKNHHTPSLKQFISPEPNTPEQIHDFFQEISSTKKQTKNTTYPEFIAKMQKNTNPLTVKLDPTAQQQITKLLKNPLWKII